ncbi:hypothetical protein OAN96_01365 [Candidatus Gracilibacteria bacterium]|nr:hypothetical protein [Candidatus Gracilibacteria bacterium]
MSRLNSKSVLGDYQQNFSSNRKQKKESIQFGLNSIYVTMLGVISMLTFYYVILLNTNATLGYDIRDLEDIQRQLLIQEQNLNVKISEIESLSNIEKHPLGEQMENVTETDHLVIKQGVQYVYNN